MYTSLSGKLAISKQLDVIANNLANMTTTGFKSEKLLFEQYNNPTQAVSFARILDGIEEPEQLNTDSFVKLRGSIADFNQGPIERTGNPLDAAIEGDGFFVVQTPDGERYTRAGDFKLDDTRKLVTQQGWAVMGSGGEVTLSGKQIDIHENGSISVDGQSVANLRVVKFSAADAQHEAGSIFKLNEGASATEVTNPVVRGGAIETSNVNAVRELTDMILASKIFESFSAVDSAASRMAQARTILGTQA